MAFLIKGNDTVGGGSASSLSNLSDTNISSPTNGQTIIYDDETGKWVNALPFRLSVVNGKIAQTITEE